MLMLNLRDSNSYLVLEEKKIGLTKKKFFQPIEARAKQSRINLKFPEMVNNNKRKTDDLKNRKHDDYLKL